jgi:methyltransferase (TIGR00027 family)
MKSISNMAFYCCGVRMKDALQENSVCGDVFAKMFMDEKGLRIYEKFEAEEMLNTCVIVRHRIIDDVLRNMILSCPDLCVVNIGAGFDSRPYRLEGGLWFELDEAPVIARKNAQLPMLECPNPLQRIPIDFCGNTLQKKLSRLPYTKNIVFVFEGIFIYLDEMSIKKLLAVIDTLFPQHHLVCDLVNRRMVENYGKRIGEIAGEMGAYFQARDYPEAIFLASGYQTKQVISLLSASATLGISKIPKSVLRYFFNDEIQGNAVHVLMKC